MTAIDRAREAWGAYEDGPFALTAQAAELRLALRCLVHAADPGHRPALHAVWFMPHDQDHVDLIASDNYRLGRFRLPVLSIDGRLKAFSLRVNDAYRVLDECQALPGPVTLSVVGPRWVLARAGEAATFLVSGEVPDDRHPDWTKATGWELVEPVTIRLTAGFLRQAAKAAGRIDGGVLLVVGRDPHAPILLTSGPYSEWVMSAQDVSGHRDPVNPA